MKNEDKITDITNEAIEVLKENVDEFLEMLIEILKDQKDDSKLEKFFKKMCHQITKTGSELRKDYLQWTFDKYGISKTRKLYNELKSHPPASLSFQLKMIEIESQMSPIDVTRLRQCFEFTTQFYGKTSVSLWMDFIRCEMEHGDPMKVGLLYERAKDCLDKAYVDDFIGSYSLMKTL